MGGYVMLPGFVVCPDRSAYEGETMHKVGELHRGDYHHSYASSLMRELFGEYCKRLRASAGDQAVEEFMASLRV